jgi:hypothetical protein
MRSQPTVYAASAELACFKPTNFCCGRRRLPGAVIWCGPCCGSPRAGLHGPQFQVPELGLLVLRMILGSSGSAAGMR